MLRDKAVFHPRYGDWKLLAYGYCRWEGRALSDGAPNSREEVSRQARYHAPDCVRLGRGPP